MFAGHAATQIDALAQDFVTGLQDPLDLFRVTLIEQQDRMNISVACMKDVYDPQIMTLAAGNDEFQNLGKLCSGYDAILSAITGTQSTDRSEGLLAALPKQ